MAPISIAFSFLCALGVFCLVMSEDAIIYRNRLRGAATIVLALIVWVTAIIATAPAAKETPIQVVFVLIVFGGMAGGAFANALRMILGKPMPESSEFDSPLFD